MHPLATPDLYWPQESIHITPSKDWICSARLGLDISQGGWKDIGREFEIAVILVDNSANQLFIKLGNKTGSPGINLPNKTEIIEHVIVTRGILDSPLKDILYIFFTILIGLAWFFRDDILGWLRKRWRKQESKANLTARLKDLNGETAIIEVHNIGNMTARNIHLSFSGKMPSGSRPSKFAYPVFDIPAGEIIPYPLNCRGWQEIVVDMKWTDDSGERGHNRIGIPLSVL